MNSGDRIASKCCKFFVFVFVCSGVILHLLIIHSLLTLNTINQLNPLFDILSYLFIVRINNNYCRLIMSTPSAHAYSGEYERKVFNLTP